MTNQSAPASSLSGRGGVPPVDFVVNCYERTYRSLLAPGVFAQLADQHRFAFADRTVLINNVYDRKAAARLAEGAVRRGDVSRFRFVADLLPQALRTTGLRPQDMRRLPHFTDCCLVAVTLGGPDWLVYWDSDALLDEPQDWIAPSLAYMAAHPDVAVANPESWHEGLAGLEAVRIDRDFAIGYGFSDVAFLVRRTEFARPIYRSIAPASWRHPLAHIEPIFEQRADAYMRRHGRLRATLRGAIYRHGSEAGLNYPNAGLRERVRRGAMRRAFKAAQLVDHPALRAWPR